MENNKAKYEDRLMQQILDNPNRTYQQKKKGMVRVLRRRGVTDEKLIELGFLQKDTAAINKAILLKMAKAGKKKPSKYSKDSEERKLGNALSNYICQSSDSYDQAFDKAIRKYWFRS
jgi:hypothetical protein